jgi:hypothetical protein
MNLDFDQGSAQIRQFANTTILEICNLSTRAV